METRETLEVVGGRDERLGRRGEGGVEGDGGRRSGSTEGKEEEEEDILVLCST